MPFSADLPQRPADPPGVWQLEDAPVSEGERHDFDPQSGRCWCGTRHAGEDWED